MSSASFPGKQAEGRRLPGLVKGLALLFLPLISRGSGQSGGPIRLHIAPMQGHYDGKLKSRRRKLQVHLASKPTSVSLNGKPVAWDYEPKPGIARLNFKAATAGDSRIEINL